MSRKSYDRGLATRRKVLGDAWVDRAIATTTPFNADFQEMITRYAWDGIWNRKGLSHKVRRMLVLATTVALGRWEEYRLHVRAALSSGDLTEGDLEEVLLQSAIYCGIPAANTAFKEAREVIAELAGGAKPARAAAGKRAKKRSARK
ncbi:MAG TPA: carboxymuconolactone decarboxylase family protein [Usitatibacter sp.]|nr:carboxymuconolactone decarboxylase family protein [Usitatibacter sp.]